MLVLSPGFAGKFTRVVKPKPRVAKYFDAPLLLMSNLEVDKEDVKHVLEAAKVLPKLTHPFILKYHSVFIERYADRCYRQNELVVISERVSHTRTLATKISQQVQEKCYFSENAVMRYFVQVRGRRPTLAIYIITVHSALFAELRPCSSAHINVELLPYAHIIS